jgi:hypothetical protein
MEPAEKCTRCSGVLAKMSGQICGRCGWDNQVQMRKCSKCQGAVALNEKIGYGPVGGMAGVAGFLFWWFFGLLLGGAIASVIGAVCGLITALTLSYACVACGKSPEARFLDTDEKEEFKKRRLGFLAGGIGLGVLALALFVGWILLWHSRLSAD